MTLTPHEGRDVMQTSIRITNAGDGLSDALTVAPAEHHIDDEVYVVLKTTCAKVTMEPIKDVDALRRVHVLRVADGTVVDASAVAKILEEHRRAVDEAKGTPQLPNGDEDE